MTGQEIAQCSLAIPKDTKFCEGHFPGNPILPAIAQLHYVFALLHEARPTAVVSQVEVARFRTVLRPGDTVSIALNESHEGGSIFFRLTGATSSALISHGRLILA